MQLPRSPIELRKHISHLLQKAEIENSFYEAKWLICAALNEDTSLFVLRGGNTLTHAQVQKIEEFLQRRLKYEPLSRIIGEKEFWSLSFQLNETTLDPRPDSEVVVESALKYIPNDAPQTILDLGTGTGCLLLSILHERPLCYGIGVDLSPDAAIQANLNATRNKLSKQSSFVSSDWGDALRDRAFDLIISNPPYIPIRDKEDLMPEVKNYDPELALYGGDDGLQYYREIAEQAPTLLKPEGICVLEIGYQQASDVIDIFKCQSFRFEEKADDIEGRDRCLVFQI